MKIPFSIEYRPQIESGEYQVTNSIGEPVRVICWDADVISLPSCGKKPIISLQQGMDNHEVVVHHLDNGKVFKSEDTLADLFIITPEPELTEFEHEVRVCVTKNLTTHIKDGNGGEISSTVFIGDDTAKKMAAELLDLAKKELCKGCAANLEGYIKGRQDALKEMEENRVYKQEGPMIPTYYPCPHGGSCTNPFRDCINCFKQSIGINTTTGTSTAKVEG